ncbi:multicopper oxidase [Bacillus sp. FJAT-27231]|uniref:multicopper oxidase family protein n=1 Tax=Bacillus sp. FJAT-27231 TaxID=1679168 RepID=UPI00069D4466
MLSQKVNPADPNTIPKFVEEVKKPPIARPAAGDSYYEIRMKEAKHQFHPAFPRTTIWGYNGVLPGPTIEARKGKTVEVKWLNNLPKKHFLPVDYTLHGAIGNPEVRSVVHLHGANVDWESDGYPEAWYTNNYEFTGPAFRRKVHAYTNHQQSATLWYHDHSMALTRLNVYAGLAGFYLLRDTNEERLNLPAGDYDIPLMIQDRSFNEDGSLFYPDTPDPDLPVFPSIVPGFLGETITVNGKVWPYLRVEPRKYRFRILNASNRREYKFSLSNDESFYQIGTDGGLLSNRTELTSFELLTAERTDIVIDFSKWKGEQITLLNTNEAEDSHTRTVMQFRVDLPLKGEDKSEVPERLYPNMDLHEHMAHTIRNLPLGISFDEYGRLMLMLDGKMWHDPVTEKPSLDSIETWNIINATPIPHPIHIHLVQFKIVERRPFNVDLFNQTGEIEFTGPPEEPRIYERGWKDTAKTDPGMVTKLVMHFKEHTGNYVWHCHFLEHEDHDMMRPIRIINDAHPVAPPHADEEPHQDDAPSNGS